MASGVTESKKLRRSNFTVTARAFEYAGRFLTSAEIKPALRRWYVDNETPKSPRIEENVWANLFCNRDEAVFSSGRFLEKCENETSYQRSLFLGLQSNPRWSFGENSIFLSNDFKIGEALDRAQGTIPSAKVASLRSAFHSHELSLAAYMSTPTVDPQLQSWRWVKDFRAWFEGIPANAPSGYDADASEKLRWLCWVEMAVASASRFDERAAWLARELRSMLVEQPVSTAAKALYEQVIDGGMEDYVERSGAGGRLHGCLRFESSADLRAAVALLEPRTRYPYSPDDPQGMVHMLPPARITQPWSVPVRQIRHLWRSGVVFESHELLDDQTLFVTCPIGLSLRAAARGACALRWSMPERTDSLRNPKTPQSDAVQHDLDFRTAPNVWLVEPTAGRSQVFADDVDGGTKFVDDDPAYSRLRDRHDSPSAFLNSMLLNHYNTLRLPYVEMDWLHEFW